MKILFISNIPTPYRNDFYNKLGETVDLTVIYEAKSAEGVLFNWDCSQVENYKAIFLNEVINERKVSFDIMKWLRMKWNLIFVTNYSYLTEMFAIIFLKVRGIPYVMEIDGGIIKKENWIKKKIKTLLIAGAKSYFSPSSQTDEMLKYYGIPEEKIIRYPFTSIRKSQISKALVSDEEKRKLRTELNIPEGNVIVGVGQLILRKGWDTLLLVAKEIDANIYIIGTGDLKVHYEEQKNRESINNIHFVGFLSNDLVTKYYRASDVFVLPTRYDVWGLVINEAMANGLPIVTTTNCAAGNALVKNGYNGFLVPFNDAKSLLKSLNTILDDENIKKQMSVNSLHEIGQYTLENMSNVHVNYIHSVF